MKGSFLWFLGNKMEERCNSSEWLIVRIHPGSGTRQSDQEQGARPDPVPELPQQAQVSPLCSTLREASLGFTYNISYFLPITCGIHETLIAPISATRGMVRRAPPASVPMWEWWGLRRPTWTTSSESWSPPRSLRRGCRSERGDPRSSILFTREWWGPPLYSQYFIFFRRQDLL